MSASDTEPGSPLSWRAPLRRQLLWLALGVAPFAVLALLHWRDLPFRDAGDYAQYMLHAKAIATGQPYSDIGYLYTPYNVMIGPRVQPPGWPLLLAPGIVMFGVELLYPKILVTLFMVAFLMVVAVRLWRDDERWVSVAAVAAVGAGLESSFATNSPISDIPFAAMLWGVFLLADTQSPLSWRRVALIGLLGSYAMSVRVIGVAIVPAVLLLGLVRPRDRTRLWALGGVWLVLGALAVVIVGLDHVPFLKLALRGPGVILGRFANLWAKYRYGLLESLLYPTPWNVPNDAYHLAALIVIPVGLFDFVRRYGRSALGCCTLCYVLIMGASPVSDQRYLWPLWPVISYSLFAGMRRVASWVPRWSGPARRLVPWAAVLLAGCPVLNGLRGHNRQPLLSRGDVQELFQWIGREKQRGLMRMMFISPRVLTLETGVPAMGYFRAPPDQVISELERTRITHVIVGDAGIEHPPIDGLMTVLTARADAFERQFSNAGFTVYRVRNLARAPPHERP